MQTTEGLPTMGELTDVKEGIGLQILKSYFRCSDALLVERR